MVGRVVSGPRGEVVVGDVSAWCEGRAAERAVGLRLGPGARGREGGLGAERGSTCGSCECLVRGQGSREGRWAANRARGLEAGRVVSGPRGQSEVGAVSGWCEDRATERAMGLRVEQGARGKEGGLGAERGSSCGSCECLVQGQGSREGK